MSNFTTEHGSGGGTSGAAAVGEIIIADSHFANPNYIEVIDGAFLDTTPYPELAATLNNSVSVTRIFDFESTINNPTPALSDQFGYSVSINSTGDRVVIGAYLDDTGATNAGSAYIYTRTGTAWTLESTINNPTPALSDYFGLSVSINSTGDRVVISAHGDDTGATDAGSAYIYTRTGTAWTLESTINNPTPALSDQFGNSVSINSTGDRVVISAYLDDTGATDAGSAYILRQFPTGTIKLTDTVYNANDSISPFLRIK